ncbi:hypothetical protein BVRB_037740 [Beta vulgaris subsp. vulgaris]|uniref:Uncharacterized protein n=1 Tax=Beta vulgaris subsp. vulgaris TaxID=3555 RepID=A0A0J7YNY0_BETVV|nr:hypothetical protein BVRB_037740 [Beta vulgaris subsp. vulgaris]
MATLYIALAVFVAVFVVIRYGVRRAAAKAKIQPPINTMFSVNELDPYTAQATANLKSQSQTVVPGTRRNSITVPGPSGS